MLHHLGLVMNRRAIGGAVSTLQHIGDTPDTQVGRSDVARAQGIFLLAKTDIHLLALVDLGQQ
jgi:hypothetical protein